jgi:3-hydroxyisobutyrate dehydrogenase-like beta-hydroxyacid dehydrogenase
MRIAFLGLMGAPMAPNLLAAGHAPTAWNRSPGRATAPDGAGAEVASSTAATAALCRTPIAARVHPDHPALLLEPERRNPAEPEGRSA